MRVRSRGAVLCVVAAGLGSALIATPGAMAATSAPVAVNCGGNGGDVAGILSGKPQSSKEILALALSAGGLTNGLPAFPTTVTSDAPDKVAVDSGDREVTLTYTVAIPPALAALARDKLGLQTILIQNLSAGVEASSGGAVLGKVTAVAPDATLSLTGGVDSITFSMKLTVSTKNPGRIFFRPTPVTMQLNFGGLNVAGIATINTASLTCDAQGVIASTSVQVKGTPSVPAVVDGPTVPGGQTAQIPLIGRSDFLPDDGNPILPDSLRIVKGVGGATISGGALIQPTTAAGGILENEVELCGAPRQTPDTPGIDEVQALTFPSNYAVKPGQELLNPHPLGMKLKFDGQETAEIPLATLVGTPLEYFGQFQAPTAAALQAALVALPNIDTGDIVVTRVADVDGGASYRFTFTGKLAASDQPQIELTGWRTQLDYSAYEGIQKAISALAGGGPITPPDPNAPPVPEDPAATTLTLEQLTAELQAGKITLESYFAKFGNAFVNSIVAGIKPEIPTILTTLEQIFPKKPEQMKTTKGGEKLIPGGSTGPLCTTFIVKTVATPTTVAAAGDVARVAPPCKVSGRTVKQRIAVRRTVAGRTRTTFRTVKSVRTVRTGGCAQALVAKGGKLTVTDLPVRGRSTTPKKVTITVTALGASGKAKVTLTVSSKTGAATGTLNLPDALAKARRLMVKISGPGVATQTRTLLPS